MPVKGAEARVVETDTGTTLRSSVSVRPRHGSRRRQLELANRTAVVATLRVVRTDGVAYVYALLARDQL